MGVFLVEIEQCGEGKKPSLSHAYRTAHHDSLIEIENLFAFVLQTSSFILSDPSSDVTMLISSKRPSRVPNHPVTMHD
jgi:hypothetical protein